MSQQPSREESTDHDMEELPSQGASSQDNHNHNRDPTTKRKLTKRQQQPAMTDEAWKEKEGWLKKNVPQSWIRDIVKAVLKPPAGKTGNYKGWPTKETLRPLMDDNGQPQFTKRGWVVVGSKLWEYNNRPEEIGIPIDIWEGITKNTAHWGVNKKQRPDIYRNDDTPKQRLPRLGIQPRKVGTGKFAAKPAPEKTKAFDPMEGWLSTQSNWVGGIDSMINKKNPTAQDLGSGHAKGRIGKIQRSNYNLASSLTSDMLSTEQQIHRAAKASTHKINELQKQLNVKDHRIKELEGNVAVLRKSLKKTRARVTALLDQKKDNQDDQATMRNKLHKLARTAVEVPAQIRRKRIRQVVDDDEENESGD
ncbi:hypothetical protein LTR28_004528 [Elasticomyces elasticus]|nr:hypothetical protein LTR28_004528 [Elasticomyces elasticus]